MSTHAQISLVNNIYPRRESLSLWRQYDGYILHTGAELYHAINELWQPYNQGSLSPSPHLIIANALATDMQYILTDKLQPNLNYHYRVTIDHDPEEYTPTLRVRVQIHRREYTDTWEETLKKILSGPYLTIDDLRKLVNKERKEYNLRREYMKDSDPYLYSHTQNLTMLEPYKSKF